MHCGGAIVGLAAKYIRCPNCGSLMGDEGVCEYCGKKFREGVYGWRL